MTVHPWNDEFAWTASEARSGRLTAAQVEAYDRDGYVVLDGAVPVERIDALLPSLDSLANEADAFLRNFDDDRLMISEADALVFGIHACTRFQEARDFVADELFADLCLDLVGPDARLYWDQIVYKYPEKPRRFPFHQDNGYGYVDPQQYLTCWVALTDATADNGCPRVVPGVHRGGTLTHTYVDPLGFECFADHPDAVTVEVEKGSVVVFSSLTPHLTGPNTTDAVRKAYILQYAPEGAAKLIGEAGDGPPERREPSNDGDRQFLVVADGARVDPPPLPSS